MVYTSIGHNQIESRLLTKFGKVVNRKTVYIQSETGNTPASVYGLFGVLHKDWSDFKLYNVTNSPPKTKQNTYSNIHTESTD
jgi:hypothetical protein